MKKLILSLALTFFVAMTLFSKPIKITIRGGGPDGYNYIQYDENFWRIKIQCLNDGLNACPARFTAKAEFGTDGETLYDLAKSSIDNGQGSGSSTLNGVTVTWSPNGTPDTYEINLDNE